MLVYCSKNGIFSGCAPSSKAYLRWTELPHAAQRWTRWDRCGQPGSEAAIPTLCSIWIWSRGHSQTSSSWAVQLCTTQPLTGQFVIPFKALSIHRGFLPKSEQQTGPREEPGLCFVWQLYTEVRIPRRFHELHFCNRKLHSWGWLSILICLSK